MCSVSRLPGDLCGRRNGLKPVHGPTAVEHIAEPGGRKVCVEEAADPSLVDMHVETNEKGKPRGKYDRSTVTKIRTWKYVADGRDRLDWGGAWMGSRGWHGWQWHG